MSTFTAGTTIVFTKRRYEFVRDGCATGLGKFCKFADEDAITVYELHRGERRYNSTMCLPGDRCTEEGE